MIIMSVELREKSSPNTVCPELRKTVQGKNPLGQMIIVLQKLK